MEKTCKDLLKEALQLHVKELKDSMAQVDIWRERFDILQKQKHRYQDEYKLLKEKNQNLSEINSNLREQVEVLKADKIRRIDNMDCAMCKRLQKVVDNLSEVYNNSFSEKDKRIASLEARLAEIQNTDKSLSLSDNTTPHKHNESVHNISSGSKRKQSPDSTCRVTPNKEECTDRDVSTCELDKCTKLRLVKKPVKRSRYQEDPSPENKRQRLSEQRSKVGETGASNRSETSSFKSNIVIPETCDFDSGLQAHANEDGRSNSEHEYSSKDLEQTLKNNTNYSERNEKPKQNVDHEEMRVIPETVPVDIDSSESDDEIDNHNTVREQVPEERQYSLRSILCSPSSGKSPLEEMDSKPDQCSKLKVQQESVSVSEKTNIKKKVAGDSDKKSDFFSRNEKVSPNQKTIKNNIICNSGKRAGHSESPCVIHLGDEASDGESPLLLKFNKSVNKDKNKLESVSKLFDIDLDSDSDEKDESSPKLKRRTRSSQTKMSRSLDENPPVHSSGQIDSDDKGSQTRRRRNRVRNYSVDKLKQTTLSQVFVNSPESDIVSSATRKLNQEEEDIQKAIELSLAEEGLDKTPENTKHDKRKGKENTPPFKKPCIPKKSEVIGGNGKRVNVNGQICNNRKKKGPISDPDETLPPNSINLIQSPTQDRKDQKSHSNTSVNVSGIVQKQLNGSLDPDIELSQLCQNSESLKESIMIDHNPSEQGTVGKMGVVSSSDKLSDSVMQCNEEVQSESVEPGENSFVATLTDFTHDDLRNAGGNLKTSTCIDLECGSQSPPCSAVSVKFGPGRKRFVRVTEDYSEDEDEAGHDKDITTIDRCPNLAGHDKDITTIDRCPNLAGHDKDITTIDGCPNLDDSFDRPPNREEDKFAYVDVVRKQDERRKLKAFECRECMEYYGGMGLSEEEIRKRIQDCSKHRARYCPPGTPEHYWDIGIEDTIVCEDRGYIQKEHTSQVKSQYRRKRQLTKIFKSKKEEKGE